MDAPEEERMESNRLPALRRYAGSAALAALAAVMLAACIAPTNAQLMEMNRNGKWREAERIGAAMLRNRGALSGGEIHETYFQVVYAKTRQGKKGEAIALMRQYDEMAAETELPPALLWVPREMTKLKGELGILGSAQKALVDAMEENGKKNYASAIGLCDKVLADPSAGDAQRATAQLVAAICLIRLGKAEEADARLTAFDALKGALPPGSQAFQDETYARSGLAELKKTEGL
jgi:hypothetical protein